MRCVQRQPASPSRRYTHLNQIFRVKALQRIEYENSVFSYEDVIKVYLSATEFLSLHKYQIPVNCRIVSVESVFVARTGGKVNRPAYLFVFTPRENSPTYLAPSSVSNTLLIASLSFAVALTILPSLNSRQMFSNFMPLAVEGTL